MFPWSSMCRSTAAARSGVPFPLRAVSSSPPAAALPKLCMDSAELQKRCGDFLRICREDGGEGSLDLSFSCDDSLAEIKINNYTKRNALSGKMMLELERIVTELESWKTGKALMLYGERDCFCSGGDLHFVRRIATPELGAQMSYFMQHTLHRLSNLPVVSLAVLRGAAHGGGAELCTACDYRMLTKSSDVRFVQAKLGITTGWGGASRLAKIVGPHVALAYLLSSEPIPHSLARGTGFAQLIFNNAEAVDMSRLWLADNILKVPAPVVRAYKTLLSRVDSSRLLEAYELETQAFSTTWGSAQHLDAIAAVLDKAPLSSAATQPGS
ncbi:ethylmalonyl-CoA decarboxylase-like [Paramacrobiotus metropolitanus]|uniref:ethylmalonyl-CoA decarboxylase-like n=1 Tax=Paramacrobiotus metropolitanus TaxID=2943436 RepID=UPI002445BFC5|nr:ethylmalonyl-CoA decarboxylase-like [Paramacrobiotus metropolitanus]